MDYTVHGILQAKILEWVAFPFSRGSPWPRDQTLVSWTSGGFFTNWTIRETQQQYRLPKYVNGQYFYFKVTYFDWFKWLAHHYFQLICFTFKIETRITRCLLLLLLSRFSRVRLCATPETAAHQAPVPGILQARTLKWVAISFSNAWKWKVKVKSLSRVRLLATPWTAAYQAPSSMRFSRQEYWSGVPLPYLVSKLICLLLISKVYMVCAVKAKEASLNMY